MKELIHTTTFASNSKSVDQKKNAGITECGYINPDGKSLPPDYLMRITSIRNKCTVVSPIQDSIKMKSTSKWEPFVPTSSLGNILTQTVTGGRRSLITKASSRRVWTGSSPMTLSVHLKFQSVKDSFMEVTEPVRLLQSMALPKDPSNGKGFDVQGMFNSIKSFDISESWKALSTIPMLMPPGPKPFTVEGLLDLEGFKTINDTIEGLKGGDVIIIEWGRLLTFYNVIVQEVVPTIFNMPDPTGNPVKAEVDITFETYEMMTVEGLEKVFDKATWAKAQQLHNIK